VFRRALVEEVEVAVAVAVAVAAAAFETLFSSPSHKWLRRRDVGVPRAFCYKRISEGEVVFLGG